MKKCCLLLALGLLPAVFAADIYLAGDSTMQPYGEKSRPMTGWGEVLQDFCKKGVVVYNRAYGGRSSKSFRNEKKWQWIMDRIKPGDFVIIQFGHNDAAKGEKNLYRSTDPEKDYPEYMRKYVRDARAQGAIPVIATQTVILRRDAQKKQFNSGSEKKYVASALRIAAEEKADVVDLNAIATEKITAMSIPEGESLYMVFPAGKYPNWKDGRKDRVHLSEAGAKFYAAEFVKVAKEKGMKIAELFN